MSLFSFVWTGHWVDIQPAMWMSGELAMWYPETSLCNPLLHWIVVFPWIFYTSYITVYTLNKNMIISCSNDFSLIPILMLMINIFRFHNIFQCTDSLFFWYIHYVHTEKIFICIFSKIISFSWKVTSTLILILSYACEFLNTYIKKR